MADSNVEATKNYMTSKLKVPLAVLPSTLKSKLALACDRQRKAEAEHGTEMVAIETDATRSSSAAGKTEPAPASESQQKLRRLKSSKTLV